MELSAFGLHAVEERAESLGGGDFVDVKHDDEIGLEISRGHARDTGDVGHGEAAGGALVGEGGADVAVGEDEFAAFERGDDAALDEFGAAGHVEEHFAADAHLEALIGTGEEDVLADAFADGRTAGLADFAQGDIESAEEGGQAAELGAFAAAVGAFEDDELSGSAAEEGGLGDGARGEALSLRAGGWGDGSGHGGMGHRCGGGGTGVSASVAAHAGREGTRPVSLPPMEASTPPTPSGHRHRLPTDTDDGMLLIISGPSGVGKTTVTRAVERSIPGSVFSVSATTRPKTEADVDGVDYHFVDDAEFDRMIGAGEFLEWVNLFGKKYGTPRRWVEEQLARGRLVILEIDVVGAIKVKQQMPEAFAVFILPPSEEALLARLRSRKREGEEAIQKRFAEARREIATARESAAGGRATYDRFIVNDVLEGTIAEAVGAVTAERERRRSVRGAREGAGG